MTESDGDLLRGLRALEVALQEPPVRTDPRRLATLLHEEFIEFGCSGNIYTKSDIIRCLSADRHQLPMLADQFAMRRLGQKWVLLTYRSGQVAADGTLERFALRASIWEHSAGGWQLRFHQGTPTAQQVSDEAAFKAPGAWPFP